MNVSTDEIYRIRLSNNFFENHEDDYLFILKKSNNTSFKCHNNNHKTEDKKIKSR